MAIFDKISGISTGFGFKYQSEAPLDARLVVDYYSELAELVAATGAYVGMLVYVKNETSINTATYPKGYYSYDGVTWTEFKGTDTPGDYNVQADWNETNTASDAFIKNKPTIPTTLPANGGNADTVDNKHASDFVQSVMIGTTEYKSGTTVTLPAYPTKSSLGLSNVTNDAQVKRSEMGVADGIATLGSDGKVPAAQLPSYVDDVLEYTAFANFPTTGEDGKIYVDKATNKTYRWSGSAYVEISASLALGTTASTAYYGDKGKIAYDHSQTTHAPSNAEKNQNAFSNVAVSGQTTVAADSTTDTLTLAAGDNITITTDATNDKITIVAKDTVYTHPTSGVTAGTYRTVTVNAQGHVTGGSNPTTLSGQGIVDAYTKTEVDNLINNLISSGMEDPSASITSQYYFKYKL